jgi:hypothetical protein
MAPIQQMRGMQRNKELWCVFDFASPNVPSSRVTNRRMPQPMNRSPSGSDRKRHSNLEMGLALKERHRMLPASEPLLINNRRIELHCTATACLGRLRRARRNRFAKSDLPNFRTEQVRHKGHSEQMHAHAPNTSAGRIRTPSGVHSFANARQTNRSLSRIGFGGSFALTNIQSRNPPHNEGGTATDGPGPISW